jgi:hypothetical protein
MTQVFHVPACGPAEPVSSACAAGTAASSSVINNMILRMARHPLGHLTMAVEPV